ncbi:MAG TPA: DUF1801 domain-containing protein [Thermoplasmata archaeon]|jgi:hypothetical protein
MKKKASRKGESSSKPIEAKVKGVPDWRGETISRLRGLIKEALPDAVEEVKWRKPSKPTGVPVWYQDGIMFHVEAFKDDVRLTFLKGASLKDPKGLFDSRIGRNAMRALLIHEGDEIDNAGIKSLLRAAAALNASSGRSTRRTLSG